jgi:DNA-binding IclR family transcriptional regulator
MLSSALTRPLPRSGEAEYDAQREQDGRPVSGVPRNQSLGRAIRVLRAMSARPEGVTASQLMEVTAIPLPTVVRILATLEDDRIVERGSNGWRVGSELIRIAGAASRHQALIALARPILRELANRTGESAILGVRTGTLAIEVVDQVEEQQLVAATSWVGRTFALHASAFGKLVLADLSDDELASVVGTGLEQCTERTIVTLAALSDEIARVRERGYAETVDELEIGLTGIAIMAPCGSGGQVALAVGGPTQRLGARKRAAVLDHLRESIARIVAASS